MRRPWLIVAAVLVAAPGCSAVGAWLYQDPSYALRAVNLRRAADNGGTTDSVELLFVGCNLNDYDITETSFLTRLSIAGRASDPGDHGQTIYLATRDTSRFTVVVPLMGDVLPEDRGFRPFEVIATSQVKTPIGDRAVNVRMAGRVERNGDQLSWKMKPQACKPGSSVLPASFDTRPAAPPTGSDRPQPMVLPGATNTGEPR